MIYIPGPPKKPDPPVRANGMCAVCGQERPPLAVKHEDPFCSTSCCKSYHRVEQGTGS